MNTNAGAAVAAVAAPELQDAFERLQFSLDMQDKRLASVFDAIGGLKARLSPYTFEDKDDNLEPINSGSEKKGYKTHAAARIEELVLQTDNLNDGLRKIEKQIQSLTLRFQG